MSESYYHNAIVYVEKVTEEVIETIRVTLFTHDQILNKSVSSNYYINLPPPSENFIPFARVDQSVLRNWASTYGEGLKYQDENTKKLKNVSM